MKKKNLLLTFIMLALFAGASFAQGLVQGVVKDANTDETLIGASVVIESTTIGITTNLDGSFILIAPVGEHVLVVSYMGYQEEKIDITIKDGSTYNVGNINLKSDAIGLDEVNVLASVAVDRETPVAVSTIDSKTIELNLGSQEFPEVMNYPPLFMSVVLVIILIVPPTELIASFDSCERHGKWMGLLVKLGRSW